MKTTLLLAFILMFEFSRAQIVSVSPNSGTYGQTLTTTITFTNGTMTMSSPPMGLNDVYLLRGNTYIYATNISYFPGFPTLADSIAATFTIPTVCPPGAYDVHAITYTCAGCPFPQPFDNLLAGGFFIGNVAGVISGNVYYDANQNGIRDTGEVGLANKLILSSPLGFIGVTGLNGDYSIASDTGNSTISINLPPNYTLTSSPTTYQVTVPPDTSGIDFGLYVSATILYAQNFCTYRGPFRCNSWGYSGWNINSISPVPHTGSVTIIHSPNLNYQSSTLAPSSINGNVLRWDYQINAYANLNTNVIYTCPPAGDTVSYIAIDSVFDNLGNFQNVYIDTCKAIVRCSYDPNDKSVNPEGEGGQHFTLKNSDLDYRIRFQNTGNDTAFNIFILDTIDLDLDLNSIEILTSSHPMNVQIEPGRVVRFTFDNIMLPDSGADEPGSHGFVIYRIHALSNIADNTPVTNTAYIYFDFNAPVVTNTTANTMVTQLPVAVQSIEHSELSYVYPNPVSDVSVLKVPVSSSLELRIFDSIGREVLSKKITGDYQLSKNKFIPGIYYYNLSEKDGSVRFNGKFVVVQ